MTKLDLDELEGLEREDHLRAQLAETRIDLEASNKARKELGIINNRLIDELQEMRARLDKAVETLNKRDCRNNPCTFYDGTEGMRTQGKCKHDGMSHSELRVELRKLVLELRAALNEIGE
jgi:hypothetical protein